MPQHLGAHPHNLHIVPEHRAPMWPQSRMPCILRHRLAGIIDHILLCFESRVWGGQSHTGKTAQQRIRSPYDATKKCCFCYILEVKQSIAVNWRILPPPAGRGKKIDKIYPGGVKSLQGKGWSWNQSLTLCAAVGPIFAVVRPGKKRWGLFNARCSHCFSRDVEAKRRRASPEVTRSVQSRCSITTSLLWQLWHPGQVFLTTNFTIVEEKGRVPTPSIPKLFSSLYSNTLRLGTSDTYDEKDRGHEIAHTW